MSLSYGPGPNSITIPLYTPHTSANSPRTLTIALEELTMGNNQMGAGGMMAEQLSIYPGTYSAHSVNGPGLGMLTRPHLSATPSGLYQSWPFAQAATLQFYLWVFTQENWAHMPWKDRGSNVHSSLTHDSPSLETQGIDEPHNGILYSDKKSRRALPTPPQNGSQARAKADAAGTRRLLIGGNLLEWWESSTLWPGCCLHTCKSHALKTWLYVHVLYLSFSKFKNKRKN